MENKIWPGWETVKLIGRGSFGAVYEIQRKLFEDEDEVEKAALKVISIPQNDSDIEEMYSDGYDEESVASTFHAHLKSIVAEYSLMRKMNGSSNIVNCDDVRYVQHDDGIGWDIYIKMELLSPLAKALPAAVSEEQVIKIAKDMCAALELCQKHNIIHRDIKPQNIFVSENGDYKLGDFGIAKTVEKTMGGTKTGTYKYMAPEVYSNRPYNSTADIYSLGLVLYWLLNERRMPFMPLPPEKLRAGMDEESRNRRFSGEKIPAPKNGSEKLKRIVLKACAFDPKERYQTAQEMRQDLLSLCSGYAEEKQLEQESVAETTQNLEMSDDATVGPAFNLQATPAMDEQEQTVGPVFKSPEPKPQMGKNRGTRHTQPKPRQQQKQWLPIAIGFVAIALVAGLLWAVGGSESKGAQSNAEMTITETETTVQMTEVIEVPQATNVLMSDSVALSTDASAQYISQPVFGSKIMRYQIKLITFLDTLKNAPSTAWDVSEEKNGSVLAWVEPDGEWDYNLYIAGEGGVTAPKDCSKLFALYEDLEAVYFNDCFDTSQVRNMDSMFLRCRELKSLDLSGFDTSQVTDMGWMFECCGNLKTLDVSSFDTAQVTDMTRMFDSCASLTSLDVSGFDTSQVTDMSYMFSGCANLTFLDVSDFDTSRVVDMHSMFVICSGLEILDTSGFDTAQVRDMGSMFYSCESLASLDVSGFDTSKVFDMREMFAYCRNLEMLDISGFDMSYANTTDMFLGCDKLVLKGTNVDGHSWDRTSSDMIRVCTDCGEVSVPPLFSFDTQINYVKNTYYNIRDMEAGGVLRKVKKDTGCYAYYDVAGQLCRVVVEKGTTGIGSHSSIFSRDYYFRDGDFLFAFYEGTESHRFYFYNDRMFRWKSTAANGNAKYMDLVFDNEYLAWEETVLEEALALLNNYTEIDETITVTQPATKPSVEDIKPFGDVITYPNKSAYLDTYEIKYVKSPGGKFIYVYWNYNGSASNSRRNIDLYEGTELIVLARQGTRSCVIFTDKYGQKQIGWVNSDYLVSEY